MLPSCWHNRHIKNKRCYMKNYYIIVDVKTNEVLGQQMSNNNKRAELLFKSKTGLVGKAVDMHEFSQLIHNKTGIKNHENHI